MTIASLIVQVAANTVQLQQDVQKITGTLDGITGAVSKFAPALAGAFTVTAVAAYAKEVIDLGGHLVDLRDKTGINVEALQILGRAADLSGNSLDQVTGAISQMQKRLAGGESGAVGALRQLNLSLGELQTLTPDQQFRTIARAIAEVEDPAQRTRLAMELFGKSGAEILPTLVSNIDAVANSTVVMSSRSAEALDTLGDAWTATVGNMKGAAGNAIADIIESFSSWEGAMEGIQMASGNMAGRLDRDLRLFQEESLKAAAAFREIPPAINDAFQVPTIDAAMQAYRKYADETERAAAETKKHAEEVKRANEQHKRQVDQLLATAAAAERAVTSTEFYQKAVKSLQDALGSLGQKWDDLNESIIRTTQGISAQDAALRTLGTTTIPGVEEEMARLGYLQNNYFDYGPTLDRASGQFTSFQGGLKESFRNTLGSLNDLFVAAFTGGGGIAGAVRGLATNATASLLNMIPVVGPFLSQFSGAIVAGMEKIGKKIAGFFRSLFGGPSADELAGRDIVAAFEDNLSEMLTDQQRIEAGGESWKETVIAIRDKYMALGLTEAEALEDAKRLWESSKQGAEASKRVIEDIKRKFEGGIRIPITLPVATPGIDSPIEPMAGGGYGRTSRPRLFLVGENGPEDYAFSGSGRRFAAPAGGDGGGDIINNVYIDGELVSRSVTKRQSRSLRSRRKLAAA